MHIHRFTETPESLERLTALARSLGRGLKSPDPVARIRAWEDNRQGHRDLGLHGITGPGACYHFVDAARCVYHAAGCVTGADAWAYSNTPKGRVKAAMQNLEKGRGFRYKRAVEALVESLYEAGVTTAAIDRFIEQRADFIERFDGFLKAVQVVNDVTPTLAPIADAVRMFADELLEVCGWLLRTQQRGQASLIEPPVSAALDRLEEDGM